MTFFLEKLPYSNDALAPYVSAQTLDVHHGKHHAGYIQKLNSLVEGTDLDGKSLEEIIFATHKVPKDVVIFNNAAQVWNHSFLWNSMTNNKTAPSEKLMGLINDSFGSYEQFAESFKAAGLAQFGSGWTWLVFNLSTKKLEIVKTSNAETPITEKLVPLITCDVWEHAYYLDYKNERTRYLDGFIQHLINWDFAEENYNKG
jgi:Fe-Mn family superoxide dismutase